MFRYFDGGDSFSAVVGVLIVFGAFAGLGLALPGRKLWERPLVGWAFAHVVSVVAALVGITDLRFTLAVIAALVLLIVPWRRPGFGRDVVIPVLVAVPLLLLSVVTPPVFADSYSHWLPNASYLHQFHHFPTTPLGDFISLHPTYPNALPLVVYASSLVTGRFAELSGNVINALMLLIAVGCLAQLIREHASGTIAPESRRPTPQLSAAVIAAIAFCIAIPLNPAIEMAHYWSTIADPALAATVLVMAAEVCRLMAGRHPALAEGRSMRVSLLVLFALGCLVAGLKPHAWPLALILAVSVAFVGWIDRIPWRRWVLPGAAILSGAVMATVLWQIYLDRHLAVPDQFVVRSLANWSWHLWDELLLAMLRILRTHTLYSMLVLATMAVGLFKLFRRRHASSDLVSLLLQLTTIVMALHVASLFAAYLGTGFEDWMITTASSFPRYTAQVGYAVCATGLLAAALKAIAPVRALLETAPPRAIWATCAAVCVALFGIQLVRPTLALESIVEERAHHRELALAALREVPAGERVVAAAPKWAINYMRYVVWVEMHPAERPTLIGALMFFKSDDDCRANQTLKQWVSNPSVDAVLLVDARPYAVRCAANPAPNQLWRRPVGRWQELRLASGPGNSDSG